MEERVILIEKFVNLGENLLSLKNFSRFFFLLVVLMSLMVFCCVVFLF